MQINLHTDKFCRLSSEDSCTVFLRLYRWLVPLLCFVLLRAAVCLWLSLAGMPPTKRRSARRQGRGGHSNAGAWGTRQQQRVEDASVQDMSLPQLLEMVRDEVRAEWQAARQTGSGTARVSFATGMVVPSSMTATATGAMVGSGPGAAISWAQPTMQQPVLYQPIQAIQSPLGSTSATATGAAGYGAAVTWTQPAMQQAGQPLFYQPVQAPLGSAPALAPAQGLIYVGLLACCT